MVLSTPSDAPTLSLFSLSNRTALITGGARGIGLAITTAFAEAGCSKIGITYSSSSKAPEIAADLSSKYNTTIKAFKMDVRDSKSVSETFTQVKKAFGRIDIVVANAGITVHEDALKMTEKDYKDVMGTNLDGAWWTAVESGKIFKEQVETEPGKAAGNLIFTGSVSAELVNVPQRQAAYNASKAGMVHMAKSLSVEWAEFGARANCVSPGFIETDMIETLPDEWKTEWHHMVPGRRFCAPYELKGVYVFLASDASSYMTGANVIVDGGYTLP